MVPATEPNMHSSHVCTDVIYTIIFYCVNTNLSRVFHTRDTCVLNVNVCLCECVS